MFSKYHRLIFSFFFLALLSGTFGCSSLSSRNPSGTASKPSPVVFLSDFGIQDESVAVCKGAMLGVEPELTIVDLTHQVPAFAVREAARLLSISTPHFPSGTVFVALVEQHTEGKKRSLVVKSKRGHYFVVPDNGLITGIQNREGIEGAREIGVGAWVPAANFQSTFYGRDVYSIVAAKLARGEDWTQVGPVAQNLKAVTLKSSKVSDTVISAEVVALDGPFGNLITSITAANFLTAGYLLGEKVPVEIGGKAFELPFVKTFDDVPVNQMLMYVDSTDHVAVAINQGNFANKHKIKPPMKLTIRKKPSSKKE